MRLLHTESFDFQEFFGDHIPKYAILSHTWEADEVTLKDVLKRRNEHIAGWKKVRKFCRFSRDHGFEWCWIDTCCIDKKSSADLSEAINSMFRWYRESAVCYAYLNDVPVDQSREVIEDNLRKSRWFTRGWCLQELLAPSKLQFVGSNWEGILGSKISFRELISQITSIPTAYIEYFPGSTVSLSGDVAIEIARSIHPHASVAQIMSWASSRQTTREEDMAYSLLGLFGINMPLLYGEGPNAFKRLQIEIMNTSEDETLFAWQFPPDLPHDDECGLLAPSPFVFKNCDFVPTAKANASVESNYRMTPRGLQFDRHLIPTPSSSTFDSILTLNACPRLVRGNNAAILKAGVFLKQQKSTGLRVRVKPDELYLHAGKFSGTAPSITMYFPKGHEV